jgi:DNA mismatch repair protein MutS
VEKQEQLPQMTLFGSSIDPNTETILNKLEASDPERMTPIDALLLLSELKRLAK